MNIVVISDIHLGVLDPEYQWENLKDPFFKYCYKNKPDIIVITGDITDHKLTVDSETALVFHMFIEELKKLNTTVLIIEGTKSHDNNQINIFSNMIDENFRIYDKVSIDTVKNLKLLFIPEEYMVDPKEYYRDYMNNKYDFVFGHGEFSHLAVHVKNKLSKIFKKLTSPLWEYKDFDKITHGNIMFGHYHIHSKYKKFYSVGSYGRYRHGEEEPKGFLTINYDEKRHKTISVKRIINHNAKKFITINESSLPEDDDLMINDLSKYLKNAYRLRISLDRNIDPKKLSIIVGFSKNDVERISIDRKYNRKNKNSNVNKLSGNSIITNKYENMSIYDATIEWIYEKHGVKFTKDQISKLLINGEI